LPGAQDLPSVLLVVCSLSGGDPGWPCRPVRHERLAQGIDVAGPGMGTVPSPISGEPKILYRTFEDEDEGLNSR